MTPRAISHYRRMIHRTTHVVGVGLLSFFAFQTASIAADARYYFDRLSTAIARHRDVDFQAEITMALSGTPTRTYYVHAAVRRPNMMRIAVSPTGYDGSDSILTVSNSNGVYYCNPATKRWSKAPNGVGLDDCLQYLPNSLSLRTALAYFEDSPFLSLIAGNDIGSVDLVDHDAKTGDVTIAGKYTSSGMTMVRRMRMKDDGTPIRYAVLVSNANGSETDVESFTLIRDGSQLADSYFAWSPPSDCVEGSELARNAPFHLVYTPDQHVRMTLTETAKTDAHHLDLRVSGQTLRSPRPAGSEQRSPVAGNDSRERCRCYRFQPTPSSNACGDPIWRHSGSSERIHRFGNIRGDTLIGAGSCGSVAGIGDSVIRFGSTVLHCRERRL